MVTFLVIFAIGLGIGLVIGNWWALLPLVGWAALILSPPWDRVGVEVPPWYAAIVFAGPMLAGTVVGVLARRALHGGVRRRVQPPQT